MSERAPYSRVYWTVRGDDRLKTIYADDHHWATWNRLLLAADMAWPAPADLPANARRASLRALVDAGVIELLPGGLFRFHGLDAERGRRRVAATSRPPSGPRPVPERSPDGFHTQGLSRAEPSRAKTSRAEAPATEDTDPADTYWTITGKYPTEDCLRWIDDLTGQFGALAVSSAVASCHMADGNARTLLGRVRDTLKRDARRLDVAEREAEQARIVENRRPTVLRREPETLTPEEADRIARDYRARVTA